MFTLFACVLCGALVLSDIFLLPMFSRIEVGGKDRDIISLQQYRADLVAELDSAEQRRNQLLLPLYGERYRSLMQYKASQRDFLGLQSEIDTLAHSFDEQQPVVHIEAYALSNEGILTISGDVRNVGPRSMTVLAQFVSALQELAILESVEGVRFSREEQPHVGPVSPFTLRLVLQ